MSRIDGIKPTTVKRRRFVLHVNPPSSKVREVDPDAVATLLIGISGGTFRLNITDDQRWEIINALDPEGED